MLVKNFDKLYSTKTPCYHLYVYSRSRRRYGKEMFEVYKYRTLKQLKQHILRMFDFGIPFDFSVRYYGGLKQKN